MKKKLIVSAIISSLILPLVGCDNNAKLTSDQQFARQQKLDQYTHEERMLALQNESHINQGNADVESKQEDRGDVFASNDGSHSNTETNNTIGNSQQTQQYDGETNDAVGQVNNTPPQQTDSGYGMGTMIAAGAAGAALGGLASNMWSKKLDANGKTHYFENGKEKSASAFKSFSQLAKKKALSTTSKVKSVGSLIANKVRQQGSNVSKSLANHGFKSRPIFRGFRSNSSYRSHSFGSHSHHRR